MSGRALQNEHEDDEEEEEVVTEEEEQDDKEEEEQDDKEDEEWGLKRKRVKRAYSRKGPPRWQTPVRDDPRYRECSTVEQMCELGARVCAENEESARAHVKTCKDRVAAQTARVFSLKSALDEFGGTNAAPAWRRRGLVDGKSVLKHMQAELNRAEKALKSSGFLSKRFHDQEKRLLQHPYRTTTRIPFVCGLEDEYLEAIGPLKRLTKDASEIKSVNVWTIQAFEKMRRGADMAVAIFREKPHLLNPSLKWFSANTGLMTSRVLDEPPYVLAVRAKMFSAALRMFDLGASIDDNALLEDVVMGIVVMLQKLENGASMDEVEAGMTLIRRIVAAGRRSGWTDRLRSKVWMWAVQISRTHVFKSTARWENREHMMIQAMHLARPDYLEILAEHMNRWSFKEFENPPGMGSVHYYCGDKKRRRNTFRISDLAASGVSFPNDFRPPKSAGYEIILPNEHTAPYLVRFMNLNPKYLGNVCARNWYMTGVVLFGAKCEIPKKNYSCHIGELPIELIRHILSFVRHKRVWKIDLLGEHVYTDIPEDEQDGDDI